MSVLSVKSEQNWKSSLLSREHKLFAPAIHAAYYSCLQQVLSVLDTKCNKNYEWIVEWCKEKGTSTHVASINLFCEELRKINKTDAASFKSKMSELKAFRPYSDYRSNEMHDDQVVKAQRFTTELLNLIKKHF
ncbi:MAG: hypothetical protein IPL92_13655 [Saprospiraceae bacterium]|nr:hypothetical protein [Candidatus Opimibacter iunctus]